MASLGSWQAGEYKGRRAPGEQPNGTLHRKYKDRKWVSREPPTEPCEWRSSLRITEGKGSLFELPASHSTSRLQDAILSIAMPNEKSKIQDHLLGSQSSTYHEHTCLLRASILRWISHSILSFHWFQGYGLFLSIETPLYSMWKHSPQCVGANQQVMFWIIVMHKKMIPLRVWSSKCTSFITHDCLRACIHLPTPPNPTHTHTNLHSTFFDSSQCISILPITCCTTARIPVGAQVSDFSPSISS